jgi:SWI/SNF-related matrix-associated actin-dependent regulator 1 of chromatin subfamily A
LNTSRQLEIDIIQMRRNYKRSYALEGEGVLHIPVPEGKKLHPFQIAGIENMVERDNVLLADDQGVGKTIQVIGTINVLNPETVIIICPATIKYQWQQFIEDWCVHPYKVQVIQGRKSQKIEGDIVIINYEVLKFQKRLVKKNWSLKVVDECDYLINENAQRTKAYQRIQADKELDLSGTPGDTPIDQWVILSNINRQLWGDYEEYTKRYCDRKPFIMGVSRKYKGKWDVGGASNVEELNLRMRSTCMVRRTKREVLPQLPPLTKELVPLDLEADDTTRIDRLKRMEYELVSQHILNKEALSDHDYEKAVDMLFEEMRINTEGSSFVTYRKELGVLKVPLIKSYIDMNLKHYEKILVITYHRDVLNELHQHYSDVSVAIPGGTSPKKRQAAIKQFQEDPEIKIIFGQILSVARGVDGLQHVCYRVILAEIDWSLRNMLQVVDRLVRMGQMNAVLASYLVLNGTLEARIAKRYLQKAEVFSKMYK